MTPRNLLVVTGSRALTEHDGEAWARAELDAVLDALEPGDVVLSGGARGPDHWAVIGAGARGLKFVELRVDGWRYENGMRISRWIDEQTHANLGPARVPLVRNRRLVECALKAAQAGWSVGVLALYAPWSTTRGTQHTCDLARAAGLPVERRTAPEAERATVQPTPAPPHATPMGTLLALPTRDGPGWNQNLGNRKIEIEPEVTRPSPKRVEVMDERADVVWLDVESGGFSPATHALLEVGAVWCDPSHRKLYGTFETKIAVAPGTFVDPGTAAVNGYTPHEWRDAPDLRTALSALLAWLPKRFVFGAFNASFDRRFLTANFARAGLPEPGWSSRDIDPKPQVRKSLANRGLTPDGKLKSACAYYGIPTDSAHRALADAECARLVWLALLGHKPASSLFGALTSTEVHP